MSKDFKDWDNDCESIFNLESYEKKKGGYGAFHNSGRRGGAARGIKGSLNMPSEWLKGQDKKAYKKYIGGSKVMEYNMYTDIANCPSIEKLNEIDPATAHNILVEVRKNNTINNIRKHLGVSGYMLYKVFDLFKIDYEKRGTKEEQRKRIIDRESAPNFVPKKKKKNKEIEIETIDNEPEVTPWIPEKTIPEVIPEKEEEFQLKYNKKTVIGAELQKRILDFMAIVYEDKKYEIAFILKELPEVE